MRDKTPAKQLISGFGTEPWPPRPLRPLPAVNGRTVALRILARYISELTFHLPGDKGSNATVPFRVPLEDVHIEQPANVEALKMPSFVFLPGTGEYLPVGLGPSIDESSFDVHAPGTALQTQSEYQETITIEAWAHSKPLRRSLVAALEVALVPTEVMYGIRFVMPDYYRQTVCFTLASSMMPDDPDAVRNRRWGHLSVEMRFDVVQLVNAATLKPLVTLDVV